MRCFVTGASGFLDSGLVRQLLRRGHSVTVSMRGAPQSRRVAAWLDCVLIVKGSLEAAEEMRGALVHDNIVIFFQLVWHGVTAELRYDPPQISTNVVGTLQSEEIAREIGCKHWIGLGSPTEYGSGTAVLLEGVAPRPVTAYGFATLATAMPAAKMSETSGIRHTQVRRQEWDHLYIEDVANEFTRITETSAVGTFHLSSGKSLEVRRPGEQLRNMINPNLPLGFGEVPYATDQVMYLKAEIGKLQGLLAGVRTPRCRKGCSGPSNGSRQRNPRGRT